MKRRKPIDVMESLDAMIGDDPELRAQIDVEMLNAEVASIIYNARVEAGLTQAKLAKMIGTTQSTIARLEDSDYDGHSLTMLRKIAAALGMRLEVRLLPARGKRDAA
jgi:ribosome-binding protein aMBF1 (putative translation factor)